VVVVSPGEGDVPRLDANLLAPIALHAHIGHRGGILADKHGREAGPLAGLEHKLSGVLGDPILDV